MSWLTLTIIAQFISSIVAIIDKYIVTSKRVTTPILYVFYTGVLTGIGVLIYIPALYIVGNSSLPSFSKVTWISFGTLVMLIVAAISQLVALWALFSSLKKNDASDVVPVVGSLSALFALIIGFMFTEVNLPPSFALGFGFLVIGTFLISHFRFSLKTFLFTLLGGFGFAVYSVLLKIILQRTSFDTGFFWITLFTSLISLTLLFSKQVRKTFHTQRKEKHIKATTLILIGNKLMAGIAGILIIKALQVGEVSLVQAMGGLQFLFLFLFAVILGPFTPIDFGENVKHKDIVHKLIAISIIFIGFVLLFL